MHGEGDVRGKGGACVAKEGMFDEGGGGMYGEGVCMAKGMCVAKGVCMAKEVVHSRGHAWQERRPLQRTVRILLECILVEQFQSHVQKQQIDVPDLGFIVVCVCALLIN